MSRASTKSRGVIIMAILALAGVTVANAELQHIAIDFYPGGDRSQGHPIRMTFEAEHVEGGRLLPAAPGAPAGGLAAEAVDPERFVAGYVAALSAGSLDDALQFWAAAERAEARGRLEPTMERQRELMSSIDTSLLHLKFRYGRYLILAVEHQRGELKGFVSIYPMIETESGLGMTNELHQDGMFQILYFTFLDGLGVSEKFRTVN